MYVELITIFIGLFVEFIHFRLLGGWAGRWMVQGGFQCRGELLLLHLVGQRPAVLTAGAGRVVYFFFFFFIIIIFFHLSSISYVLSFGRRLNMTEIL